MSPPPDPPRPLDDVASGLPFAESEGLLPLVEELLAAGRAVRLRVTGRSMAPHLREGDVVTLRRGDPGAAAAGDILLFRTAAGQPVLHRVVGRRAGRDGEPRLLLKGDALPAADDPVDGSQVIGAAVAVERAGGGGARRTIDLTQPRRRAWGRFLAGASLRAPRLFRAVSMRLARGGGR